MLQEILPYLSILLQWARAQQKFSEVWYAGIVVVASFGFYLWATPTPFSGPWQDIVGLWWEQAKTILALTQAVSTGANIAVKLKAGSPSNPLIPVTNSKP